MLCTTGFPKTALPESMPQSGTPKLFTFLYSLFTRPAPAFPSHFPGAPESCSAGGAEDQFPGSNAGLQNALSPRTAPHAGHRLVLNPCRRAAHHNYSLFTLLYSLVPPRPFPPTPRERQRAAQQGAGDQFPGGNAGLQNALSPHSLACRAQAHSEPVPQSGTPQLFTFLYSLFTLPALPLFPSGADSKTKNIFCFLVT